MDYDGKKPIVNTKQVILSVLLGIVILIAAQLLSLLIGNAAYAIGLPIAVGNILAGILYPIFALLSVTLLCKKILGITLRELKITKITLKPVWCIVAILMPIIVSVLFLLTPGQWVEPSPSNVDIINTITSGVFFIGISTGIVEEAIFRGVIMSALEYRWNKRVAIIVPSILFGIVHIFGNDLDLLSCIQLIIAGSAVGILFSFIAYESGNIWSGALVHALWNIGIIGRILHIGTQVDDTAIYNYVLDTKSYLLSGGDFGIEASIIGIVVYLLFSLLAFLLIRKRRTNYL